MEKKEIEIVKKLINMNLSLEQIMEVIELTEKHIKEIKSKLS
ncbi:hypothetical protein [Anaerosalibacter massiliensis]|uniref:Uncharacterized protein n=1 Tax=Anaerosalibacter massiliensis TaxID=1347392 RepID=A0A9X2S7W3_9FIRM|nr:hypothetical protein [Anaerosalibacter massiliensis]MCR2044431.1 hypothetical protein [Anaerosalibacter massiliensis]